LEPWFTITPNPDLDRSTGREEWRRIHRAARMATNAFRADPKGQQKLFGDLIRRLMYGDAA